MMCSFVVTDIQVQPTLQLPARKTVRTQSYYVSLDTLRAQPFKYEHFSNIFSVVIVVGAGRASPYDKYTSFAILP